MTQILRIDSSVRTEGSHSRELADIWQAAWLKRHPDDKVVYRDLAKKPVPHITNAMLKATDVGMAANDRTDEMKAAIALSDELVDEFLAADRLLMSVPMYNFSIPSSLKAYIDQIVRVGRTFAFEPEQGFYGLAKDKPTFIAVAYGGAGYRDAGYRSLNFVEPYLEGLLSFLGIQSVTFLAIEGTAIDPAIAEATKQEAIATIERSVQA